MQDGLARAGLALAATDLVCAFYGDLFRPSGKVATDPPWDAADVDAGFKAELLERWWREAAQVDPQVSSPAAQTKVGTPQFVQRALDALSNSKFFAGLAERALIADLKLLRRYLNESDTRVAVRDRVEQVISESEAALKCDPSGGDPLLDEKPLAFAQPALLPASQGWPSRLLVAADSRRGTPRGA